MGEADKNAARRVELIRVAHDLLHSDVPDKVDKAHAALHAAIGDDAIPDDTSETAAADLRPFDRAFTRAAVSHEVNAVWIAASKGRLITGGHAGLNQAVGNIMAAGMQALGGSPTPPPDPLWTPNGSNGPGLIVPGNN